MGPLINNGDHPSYHLTDYIKCLREICKCIYDTHMSYGAVCMHVCMCVCVWCVCSVCVCGVCGVCARCVHVCE